MTKLLLALILAVAAPLPCDGNGTNAGLFLVVDSEDGDDADTNYDSSNDEEDYSSAAVTVALFVVAIAIVCIAYFYATRKDLICGNNATVLPTTHEQHKATATSSKELLLEEAVIQQKEGIVVSATRKKGRPVGIDLRSIPGWEAVYVHAIEKSSCFAGTYLRKGMRVTFINHHYCGDLPTALQLLEEPCQTISLTILRDKTSLAVASVLQSHSNANVGLGLGIDNTTGKVSIASLDGLFAGSDLRVGMSVLQINNKRCKRLALAEAKGILFEATTTEGPLTVLADSNPEIEADDLVVASVVKPTKETRVGLRLELGSGNMIRISTLGGLFARTDLVAGMAVLKINNTEVAGMTVDEAVGTIASAVGVVAVLARHDNPDLEAGHGEAFSTKDFEG